MGLLYDSWGTYAARKVIKGVNRKPRKVRLPSEESDLTRELVLFYLYPIILLGRAVERAARWALRLHRERVTA